MEQATVAGAGFPGDMAVPPVSSEAITAVLLGRRIDGDLIRAFELEDVRNPAGDTGVSPAGGVGVETNADSEQASCKASISRIWVLLVVK